MSAKTIFVVCAQALLVQLALTQCTSRAAIDASGYAAPYGLAGPALAPALAYDGLAAPFAAPAFGLGAPLAPLAYDAIAAPCAYDGLAGWGGLGYDGVYAPALDFTPTSGGGLTVTSASAIPPTGISIISENVYEGSLAVAGQIPFVGTTGVEGVLSTAGAGAVNHACGNGINAMVSETTAFAPEFAATIAPAALTVGPLATAPFAAAPLAAAPFAAAPFAAAPFAAAPFAAAPFATAPLAAAPFAPAFGVAATYTGCGCGI